MSVANQVMVKVINLVFQSADSYTVRSIKEGVKEVLSALGFIFDVYH